jgi:hypothetical protein
VTEVRDRLNTQAGIPFSVIFVRYLLEGGGAMRGLAIICIVCAFWALNLARSADAQETIPPDMQKDLAKDLSSIQEMLDGYNSSKKLMGIHDVSKWNWTIGKEFVVATDPEVPLKDLADIKSNTIAIYPKGSIFAKVGEQDGFIKVDIAGREGWIPKTSTAEPRKIGFSEVYDAIQTGVIESKGSAYQNVSTSVQDKILENIVNRLIDVRNKWKNNPYIEADGFQITLGVTMGVDFSFKFK